MEKTENVINEVLEFFGKTDKGIDVVTQRLSRYQEKIDLFLEENGLTEHCRVDLHLLRQAILDYFVDIMRVRKFHKKIKHVNRNIITAYEAYWILRRKPIQVVKLKEKVKLEFVNERFVVESVFMHHIIWYYQAEIHETSEDDLVRAKNDLYYYTKYRDNNAKAYELMLGLFTFGLVCE